MQLCKFLKLTALVTLVAFVFSTVPVPTAHTFYKCRTSALAQVSTLAPVCSAVERADGAVELLDRDVRHSDEKKEPEEKYGVMNRLGDMLWEIGYFVRHHRGIVFTVIAGVAIALVLIFPLRGVFTPNDAVPLPTATVQPTETPSPHVREPDWTQDGREGYWLTQHPGIAFYSEDISDIKLLVYPYAESGRIWIESGMPKSNDLQWEDQRIGMEIEFSASDLDADGALVIDLGRIYAEHPLWGNTIYQVVTFDSLVMNKVIIDGPAVMVDTPSMISIYSATGTVGEVFGTAAAQLADLQSEAWQFEAAPGDLQAADISTWWSMVSANNNFLTHPVWFPGLTVDKYATSESISYELMTAWAGYEMSGGDAQYCELMKQAMSAFSQAINISGKGNLQLPWLIDPGRNLAVDLNSASDSDALVLSLLIQMREAGVFDSAAFDGWTVEINGAAYDADALISALRADFVGNTIYNAAPAQTEPFYIVGVSDGVADANWATATGQDGEPLVLVNTSYNIWVDPAGDETLEQGQINLLRTILATQTWRLDGGEGTRSNESMGSFPGWTDISADGTAFSVNSRMTQETVTLYGHEFTFWVLDQDSAGFSLSQERLTEKNLVSFQNYEGHRMLVFAVDMQQRIYEKQLMFESTGDEAYRLTEGELEAYRLAACILENYMSFQKMVFYGQGEYAMANDAYYITGSDYGDLGADVGVYDSTPGRPHAYASDTKAGTIAAHLMAAMAVGDGNLIAVYADQLVTALNFMDIALDEAQARYGENASPLHAYGKDGADTNYELGNYYFENAFVNELLHSFPTTVLPSFDVLQDPARRAEQEEARMNVTVMDTAPPATAGSEDGQEEARKEVFDFSLAEGLATGVITLGDGISADSQGADFSDGGQSIFVDLSLISGIELDTWIDRIEIKVTDTDGNLISGMKVGAQIQEEPESKDWIVGEVSSDGDIIVEISPGYTVNDGRILRIFLGSSEGPVDNVKFEILVYPWYFSEEDSGADTGADTDAAEADAGADTAEDMAEADTDASADSDSSADAGLGVSMGMLLGAAGMENGKRRKRKPCTIYMVDDNPFNSDLQYPRIRNVMLMYDPAFRVRVAGLPYFVNGKGAWLTPEQRKETIHALVAEMRRQMTDMILKLVASDKRTLDHLFVFEGMADAIDNVPQEILDGLFGEEEGELIAVLSPERVDERLYEIACSA